MEEKNKIDSIYKKYRKIIIPAVVCYFILSFSGLMSIFIMGLFYLLSPDELSEFSCIALEVILSISSFFLIFAIIQILVREIHRFSHLKLIDTLIISVALFELLALSFGIEPFFLGSVVIFGAGWVHLIFAMGQLLSCFLHTIFPLIDTFSCSGAEIIIGTFHLICTILAYISILVIVAMRKRMSIKKFILYLFFIPQLIVGIGTIFSSID